MKRIGFLVFLAGACAMVFHGCQTTDSATATKSVPASPDVLRVGVSANSRPMIYKQGGEFMGFDADLARLLGKELGREVVFIEIPWDEQIEALDMNKTDIILSNMTITPARQTRVAFTLPYLRSGQMALIRRTDVRGDFKSVSDVVVTDRRIGVERGTTGEFFAESNCINATLKRFADPADGARALSENKIDVFLHDAPVVWRLAGEYESAGLVPLNSLLTREYIAGAVRITDTELVGEVNQALSKWNKDGTLNNLSRRWVPFL